jgi:hypothetical protein
MCWREYLREHTGVRFHMEMPLNESGSARANAATVCPVTVINSEEGLELKRPTWHHLDDTAISQHNGTLQ